VVEKFIPEKKLFVKQDILINFKLKQINDELQLFDSLFIDDYNR